jgi:hypothetical protein
VGAGLQFEQAADGRVLVYEFTREALAIQVAKSIDANPDRSGARPARPSAGRRH